MDRAKILSDFLEDIYSRIKNTETPYQDIRKYLDTLYSNDEVLENEIWKDINGYENVFQVSSIGRIRSVDRLIVRNKQGNFIKKGKIFKPNITPKKYLRLQLAHRKIMKNFMIHRLVAETFIPNINNLEIVLFQILKTNQR